MRTAVFTTAVLLILTPSAFCAPDTLVVCPAEFRAAWAPWEDLRRSQGHEIETVDVPRDANALQAVVRRAAAGGRLQTLILIGDVPGARSSPGEAKTIPTAYVPAKVNRRWGSEDTIATDSSFADVDGDGAPDIAVGRIPADSSKELAAVVRKILKYESRTGEEPWARKLVALAGTGEFGPLADRMIETAAQQLAEQALPPGFLVQLTRTKTGSLKPFVHDGPVPDSMLGKQPEPRRPLGQQIDDGSLLWVYMGHGHTMALDYVEGDFPWQPPKSILSVEDVPKLRGGARCPVALFVTCYAGRCDGPADGLAEELLLAEEGPVSVIAATRVSMPFGNTVFSYEFMRASLGDRPATLGAAFCLAQQRALTAGDGDAMRQSIETMALTLSPLLPTSGERWRVEDLATERREHVAMYQLLGDPLLRWRRPRQMELKVERPTVVAGDEIVLAGASAFDGDCLVELSREAAADTSKDLDSSAGVVAKKTERVAAGAFRVTVRVPPELTGRLVARAYLTGQGETAVGGVHVEVRGQE